MCVATETELQVHPFEKAGLGKAPFRYAGIDYQEINYGMANVGTIGGIPVLTKPGGTCAYCGQYIVAMFNVESADGQLFHVGSDCINKVDARIAKAIKPELKKRKDAREASRIATAKAAFTTDPGTLATRPHPTPFMAAKGATLAEYVAFLFRHGGKSGQLRAARLVETSNA